MSRIGRQPVPIPSGVTVTATGDAVTAKGPKGEVRQALPPMTRARVEDGKRVIVETSGDSDRAKSFHGLARSLVANIVRGVSEGYSRELDMEGVGFRAALQGRTLELAVGFSAPIRYPIPAGVQVSVQGGTAIQVAGPDKQKVGEVAARLRAFFPAEPYKGKGLRYRGERVRRKVGKTVA
jgi:large subunit ribosomal protein L6